MMQMTSVQGHAHADTSAKTAPSAPRAVLLLVPFLVPFPDDVSVSVSVQMYKAYCLLATISDRELISGIAQHWGRANDGA